MTAEEKSKFRYFNSKRVIGPFGLPNVGSICHFNSMFQSLMSCTSLVEKIPDNPLGRGVVKCLKDNNSIELSELLRKLVMHRKDHVKFTYGQQSASEGLILMLEQLGPSIDILFKNRTKVMIFCDCKKSLSLSEKESVSSKNSEEFLLCIPTDYKGDINKYITFLRKNTEELSDFICPKCKSKQPKTIRSSLVMIPEILVFLSKKYNNQRQVTSTQTQFAEFIEIEKIKYRAVAYIQHMGSLSGGHYFAVCLRKSGENLNWYTLNDTSVSGATFAPDQNTYMVFYHVYQM